MIAQELMKLGADESKISEGEDLADGAVLAAGKKLRAALSALRLAEMSQQVESFAHEVRQALTNSKEVRC